MSWTGYPAAALLIVVVRWTEAGMQAGGQWDIVSGGCLMLRGMRLTGSQGMTGDAEAQPPRGLSRQGHAEAWAQAQAHW